MHAQPKCFNQERHVGSYRIPRGTSSVAQIEILAERESRGGWEFDANVLDNSGRLQRHRVTLSWADYNLWSADGADEPTKVAEAVIAFMIARSGDEALPAKFDASLARRKFADADAQIPRLIGR